MHTSPLARLVVMFVLLIGLMIPLLMIYSVVSDRTSRRSEATHALRSEWGGAQTLAGPVLTVPYRYGWRDATGALHEKAERLFVLPESLAVDGIVETEVRKRGLFEVVVYTAKLKIKGRFPKPDMAVIRPSPMAVDWDNATVDVGVSDPRGIARRTVLNLNGRPMPARPGVTANGLFATGVRSSIEGFSAESDALTFDYELELKGTHSLLFVPSGDETTVTLASGWEHPSFIGGPQERTIDPNGFKASWRVPYFARGFSARWTGEDMRAEERQIQAASTAFGVSLIRPVDIYVQTERAVKYAALFIVLTFVVAFLWEVTGHVLVHPIQYTFVGFALCIFYLLLLSLAEHIGFDSAYAAAAICTIALLSWYWTWVLNGVGRGALMGVVLVALYSFLYLLLRLEDYALLAGSLGLFVMLAVVMFLTRRVNWYNLRLAEPVKSE